MNKTRTLSNSGRLRPLSAPPERLEYVNVAFGGNGNGVSELAEKYDIPPFVVQRAFNVAMALEEYFKEKEPDAQKGKSGRPDQRGSG
jgi:hypothetical protein